MTISGYWNFHEETRLDTRQKKWLKRQETILTRFIYIVIILATITNYFIDRKTFFTLLPLSIIVLSIIFLPTIARRYFKNGLAVFVVSFFAITFFVNIASNTLRSVYSIKNEQDSTKYIITNTEIPVSLDNLVLVTSGSYYKVFWDKVGEQTVLVKSDLLIGVIEKSEKPK
jgi:hypothetical protein